MLSSSLRRTSDDHFNRYLEFPSTERKRIWTVRTTGYKLRFTRKIHHGTNVADRHENRVRRIR